MLIRRGQIFRIRSTKMVSATCQKCHNMVICWTVSHSRVQTGIESMSLQTKDIQNMLNTLHRRTYQQWVPDLLNVPDNKLTDRATKQAPSLSIMVLPEQSLGVTSRMRNQYITSPQNLIKDTLGSR